MADETTAAEAEGIGEKMARSYGEEPKPVDKLAAEAEQIIAEQSVSEALKVTELPEAMDLVESATRAALEPSRTSSVAEVILTEDGRLHERAPLEQRMGLVNPEPKGTLTVTWAVWLGFRVQAEHDVKPALIALSALLDTIRRHGYLHGRMTPFFRIQLREPFGTCVGIYPHVFMGVGKGPQDFVSWARANHLRGIIEQEGGLPPAYDPDQDHDVLIAWAQEHADVEALLRVKLAAFEVASKKVPQQPEHSKPPVSDEPPPRVEPTEATTHYVQTVETGECALHKVKLVAVCPTCTGLFEDPASREARHAQALANGPSEPASAPNSSAEAPKAVPEGAEPSDANLWLPGALDGLRAGRVIRLEPKDVLAIKTAYPVSKATIDRLKAGLREHLGFEPLVICLTGDDGLRVLRWSAPVVPVFDPTTD